MCGCSNCAGCAGKGNEVNQADLMKYGIAAGVLFAAYKFAPNPQVKTGVVAVAALAVASRLPYVKEVL